MKRSARQSFSGMTAALVAAGLAVSAGADQGCNYNHGDGDPHFGYDIGITGDAFFVTATPYVAESGCETIHTIRVRFSSQAGGQDEVDGDTVGREYYYYLYDDTDNNGNPDNANLLVSGTSRVPYPYQNTYIDIPITPTAVSGVFWVAIGVDTLANRNAMPIDTDAAVGLDIDGDEMPDDLNGDRIIDNNDLDLTWSWINVVGSEDDPFAEPVSGQLSVIATFAPGAWIIEALGNSEAIGPGPTNDEAADAFIVGEGTTVFDTSGAGNSAGAWTCGTSPGSDVWFVYVSGCRGTASASVSGGGFSAAVEVHAGVTPGTVVGCGSGSASWDADTGEVFLIRVGGDNGGAGDDAELVVECDADVPTNDDCTGAIPLALSGGGSASATGTTLQSSYEGDDLVIGTDIQTCDVLTQIDGPGVWYSFTGTGNTVTVSICNPGTNWPVGVLGEGPRLNVYCNECIFPICAAANGDAPCASGNPAALLSTVTMCTLAGESYLILIHGDESTQGDFELTLQDDGLPCMGAANCAVDNANCLFPDDVAIGSTVGPQDLCSATPGPQPTDLCGHSEFTSARWFRVVGDGTTLTASLCFQAEYDSALAVYTGGCGNLTCAAITIPDLCFPNETVSWGSTFGVEYLVRVFADFGCGNFSLTVTSNGVDQTPYVCNAGGGSPPNDCCDSPTAVNGNIAMPFDNANAATDPVGVDPSNPCGSANADAEIWNDLWYLVTAPETGDMTVGICDGTAIVSDEDGQAPPDGFFDSKIAVYDVTGEDAGDCSESAVLANIVGCNEDCTADPTSEITVAVVAGNQYLVRLGSFDSDQDGTDGERGSGTITFSFGGGPACVGDTNGDLIVNVDDLVNVILDWGTNGAANGGDVDGSGLVNVDDLVTVILAWGPCT